MKLSDLLRDRAHRHLIDWVRSEAIRRLEDESLSDEDRQLGVDYGLSAFRQLNEILWTAIREVDPAGFEVVATNWAKTLWDADRHGLNDEHLRPLEEEHDRYLLGLAMWILHSAERAKDTRDIANLGSMFRVAGGHLGQPSRVAAALARSSEHDEPWTTWFLSELPEGEAHIIPTRPKLLQTALALAVYMNADGSPLDDDTLLYSGGEVEASMSSLRQRCGLLAALTLGPRADPTTVKPAISPPGEDQPEEEIHERLRMLQERLARAEDAAQSRREAAIVVAEPNPEMLDAFRRELLDTQRGSRLFHDLLVLHGACREVPPPGDDE